MGAYRFKMSKGSAHDAISSSGTARKSRRKAAEPQPPNLIERTNSLPLDSLKSHYLPAELLSFTLSSDNGISIQYVIDLHTSASLPTPLFDACFQLLQDNMSASYKATNLGWHPRKKKEEMKHPAMRYLILSEGNSNAFAGFLEFMITEEEGDEVIYTYELDIPSSFQGLGLGKKLLDVVESFGENVGVGKSMLTVFDINTRAMKFYEREGYVIDEISPDPKILRNGLVKQPCYHILSKKLQNNK